MVLPEERGPVLMLRFNMADESAEKCNEFIVDQKIVV